MARSDPGDVERLLSPRTDVVLAGFSAPAHALQSQGWRFAVNRLRSVKDPYGDTIQVVAQHQGLDLTATGSVRLGPLMAASDWRCGRRGEEQIPVIELNQLRPSDRVQLVQSHGPFRMAGPGWQPVDMRPDFVHDQAQLRAAVLGVFKPWTSEIIVPQSKTIDDLLTEIRALQVPDLAAARERARTREWREGQAQNSLVQVLVVA